MFNAGLNLLGRKVQVSEFIASVPKMVLHRNCPCTDEFRLAYDAWLREFFGLHEVAYCSGDTMFISPAAYHQLKLDSKNGFLDKAPD